MAKVQRTIKFTYEDYRNLPESETKRYELLGGELLMTPSPTWKHQSILLELSYRLKAFVLEKDLGILALAPLDVIFSEEDVAQPDMLLIAQECADIIQEDGIHGAPDLVIEILSPSTAQRDRTYKRTLYARHGVKEYWLVDPQTETIEVLSLGQQGYQQTRLFERDQSLHSPLLPGLLIGLNQIF